MGAAASTINQNDIFLNEAKELEIYRCLQKEYEDKSKQIGDTMNHDEKDKYVYNHLKTQYENMITPRFNNNDKEEMISNETKDTNTIKIHSFKNDINNNNNNHYNHSRNSTSLKISIKSPLKAMIGDIVIFSKTKNLYWNQIEDDIINEEMEMNPNELITEGMIIGISLDKKLFQVEIGEGKILDNISFDYIDHLISWETLELHDVVKVRDKLSYRYYEAEIIDIYENGTCKVEYDENEIEDQVDRNRIIKIVSGRSLQAYKKWHIAKTMIVASNTLKGNTTLNTNSMNEFKNEFNEESKELPNEII